MDQAVQSYPSENQTFGSSQTGALTPTRSNPVTDALARLEKGISILKDVRMGLTARLHLITSPKEPMPESGDKPKDPRVSLANGLHSLAERIETEISEIQDLQRRLEI